MGNRLLVYMYELSEIIVVHVLNCDILSVQKEQLNLKKGVLSFFPKK